MQSYLLIYLPQEDVESSEIKTISVGAGLGPKISFGDLTISNSLHDYFFTHAIFAMGTG